MKYRKKPLVIDAWKVGTEPIPHWIDFAIADEQLEFHRDGYFLVENDACTEGFHLRVEKGDWIIRGIEGELYPCSDSVFQKSYERVGE